MAHIARLLLAVFLLAMGEEKAIADVSDMPTGARVQASVPAVPEMGAPTSLPMTNYVLGVGDRVRVIVYGEEDLSGDYEINSTGMLAFPLIGETRAAEQTVQQFEAALRTKLKSGYLNDPRVSVQVITYRPFFILGEVSKPGGYPYVNGMTVLNAAALAGGYTYRADEGGVTIVHAADSAKKEQRAREDAVVMPGDIVRVPERLF